MKRFDTFKFIPEEFTNSAVAIGNFDGIHLGHKKVFSITREIAQKEGIPSAILTFEPHPRQYFSPDSPPFRLVTSETRANLIEACGFDALFEIQFDKHLSNLTSEEFITQVLLEGLKVSHVVVGEDFRYGKKRQGDTEQLVLMGSSLGFEVSVLPKHSNSYLTYSSSTVRTALKEGDLQVARDCLDRWHSVEGVVKKGQKNGKSIGFPTANLDFDGVVIPKFGVYAVFVDILTGKYRGNYLGASSIGTKPTFGNFNTNLETYIFDFKGDIYGEHISVSLVHYLRPEIKFDSVDDLVTQMKSDCQKSREYLASVSR
ncbi:MAG: bifunctional riboflavin kinase/FAD synthetase [Rhodobacteraceae bacterium]|nr:bifunctional riboflavin kinase/FAD synthetase [Paracoccaceae bacterium]